MQMQPMRDRAARNMCCRAAILAVAEDRCADRRAMRAKLVRAPGQRQQREPARPIAGAIDDGVIGDRILAVVVGMNTLAALGAVKHSLGKGGVDTPLAPV